MPLCQKEPYYCPVEKEAQDTGISALILGYQKYRQLLAHDAPAELQLAALRECGALELGADFVVAMDSVFYEWRRIEQEKEQKKQDAERQRKDRINAAKAKARKNRAPMRG